MGLPPLCRICRFHISTLEFNTSPGLRTNENPFSISLSLESVSHARLNWKLVYSLLSDIQLLKFSKHFQTKPMEIER